MKATSVIVISDQQHLVLEGAPSHLVFEYVDSLNHPKLSSDPNLVLIDLGTSFLTTDEELEALIQELSGSLVFILAPSDYCQDRMLEILEYGAEDYIAKDIIPALLFRKLTHAVDQKQAIQKTEKKLKNSKKAAFSAMENANALGVVLDFLSQSDGNTYANLAEAVFTAFKKLDIQGSVQFYPTDEAPVDYSDDGGIREKESQLMLETHESQASLSSRFVELHGQVIVAGDLASIFVRHRPERLDKLGVLLDVLGAFVHALDSKCAGLQVTEIHKSNDSLVDVIGYTENTLIELSQNLSTNSLDTFNTLDGLIGDMEAGLSCMAMTYEQEQYFLELLANSVEKLIQIRGEDQFFQKSYQNIIEILKPLCHKAGNQP